MVRERDVSTGFITAGARVIGESGTSPFRPIAVALFAALLSVTACAGQTAAQKVFELTAVYNAVLAPVVEYESLPRCTEASEPLDVCSKRDVVAVIRKADRVAFAAINGAQAVVRNPASSEDQVNFALNAAEEAIIRFRQVARTFNLIGG